MPRVVAGQQEAGKNCPFCQTPIKPGAHVQVCDACRMPHHVECWQQNRGCTTFGCRMAGSAGGTSPQQLPTYQNPYSQPPRPYPQQPLGYPGSQSRLPMLGMKDYLVEAILVTIFCCMPFGIVSIVYASQARSAIAMGDWATAQRAAGSARAWVTASFLCGIIPMGLWFFGILLGGLGSVGGY